MDLGRDQGGREPSGSAQAASCPGSSNFRAAGSSGLSVGEQTEGGHNGRG